MASDSVAQQAEHTPEPWRAGNPTGREVRITGDVKDHAEGGWCGLSVALMFGGPARDANARRIVAAVNAVRDIPTDVLELVGGHELPVIRIGCLALALEEIGETVAGQMPDDQYAGIGQTIGAAERPLAEMLKRLADDRGPLTDRAFPHTDPLRPAPPSARNGEGADGFDVLPLEPTDAAVAEALAAIKPNLDL